MNGKVLGLDIGVASVEQKKSAEQGRAKLIMDNHILTQKVYTFWLCCFE